MEIFIHVMLQTFNRLKPLKTSQGMSGCLQFLERLFNRSYLECYVFVIKQTF
jgi:hypothetical protein